MLRGEEIDIRPIKCINKESNECLTDYVYRLNGILYPLTKRYITNKAKERLLGQLKEICTELSSTDFPARCKPKKEEILEKCRDIYGNVRIYVSDDNPTQCQAVVKYATSQYLRNKPQDDEDILKMLQANKQIAEDYGSNTAFKKMQDELINMINTKYKI